MNKKTMNKMMRLILCAALIAAMALTAVGCGGKANETKAAGTSFTFVVTDLEGKETSFDITTQKATVGEALLDQGLIEGEDGEYGLYVTTVNGVSADWDKDQTYWAFYIDGEYAMTGVDATEVTAGATYSMVLTKG